MNSAYRILSLYDKAMKLQSPNGFQLIQLWGIVFDVKDEPDRSHEDAISMLLIALRDEVEITRTKLLGLKCPPELFEGYLGRIKNIASPSLLQQDWQSHKNGLTNDIRLALAWAAWSLPDEEHEIEADELIELLAEIESLHEAIEQSELSPHLKEFSIRQLRLIRSSLQVYQVAGITPVEKALEQSVGAFTMNRGAIAKEVNENNRNILGRITNIVTKAAGIADKVDKLNKGAHVAIEFGRTVGDLIGNAIKF